jgi:hypothetical protein
LSVAIVLAIASVNEAGKSRGYPAFFIELRHAAHKIINTGHGAGWQVSISVHTCLYLVQSSSWA